MNQLQTLTNDEYEDTYTKVVETPTMTEMDQLIVDSKGMATDI